MGHIGNTINDTGGIKIHADIRTVLGETSDDLRVLCRSSKINPWAKNKPFAYSALNFSNASARLTARRYRNCGLVIKDYGNSWALYAAMVAAGNNADGWKYDAPIGTIVAPFRAGDFNGYNGDVVAPLQVSVYPNPAYKGDTPRISDEGGTGVSDISVEDLLGDDSNALNSALRTAGYKYKTVLGLNIGVMLGTDYEVPEYAYTVGTVDDISMRYITPPGSSGSYYVVPFISNKIFSGNALDENGIFLPCPIAMKIWDYHNYFPFMDRGTYREPGSLSVHLNVEVLQTISYTSLAVEFSADGSTWGSPTTIYSNPGTLNAGTFIQGNKISLTPDPEFFRLIVSGISDTRSFTIASSPIE